MEAAAALAELAELSSQVEQAVVLRADGSVLAATPEGSPPEALASTALELIAVAEPVSPLALSAHASELDELEGAGLARLDRTGEVVLAHRQAASIAESALARSAIRP